MVRIKTLLTLSALVVTAAVTTSNAKGALAQGNGKITGKISFKGTLPEPIRIRMSADPRCAQANPGGSERRQVDVAGGGLASVIVSLTNPPRGGAPITTPAVLDQSGCMYTPAAIGLMVNQPLKIRNSDDTLHNVHPRPTVNAGFNIGQPRKGMETEKKFDKPETFFPVSCDVHPWMRSYIAVFDHPYFAVTKADGTFEIANVPPGTYDVQAQHPTLKIMTGKVTVKAGGEGKLDLTFVGK